MNQLDFVKHIRKMLLSVWKYIKPYRVWVVVTLVLSSLISLIQLGIVRLAGMIQDQVFVGKQFERLMFLSCTLGGIFLVSLILRYSQRMTLKYVAEKASVALRNELFQKILHLDLRQIQARSASEILSRFLNDTKIFYSGLEHFSDIIKKGLTIIVLVVYAFISNWKFSIFFLFAAPIVAYSFYWLHEAARKKTHQAQVLLANMTRQYEEAISGIREIHIYQRKAEIISFFDRENQSFFKKWMHIVHFEEIAPPLLEFLCAIVGALVLFWGGYAVIQGEMSSGAFLSYLVALGLIQQPMRDMSQINVKMAEASAAAQRIAQFLATDSSIESQDSAKTTTQPSSSPQQIQMENVSFCYVPGYPVISNMNTTFRMGLKHAIVGPSGCGKTTVFNLIIRFYDPDSGCITMDGIDIRRFFPGDYRKLFSLVTQEPFLFHDTVFSNIGFSKPNASEDEIVMAAKAAYAHDFILALPKGYNTIVGDRGIRLSGGQRQRISIARAFLKNSPILMFDEATSHLDSESEQKISEALARLEQHKTSFVVAHRLATVFSADNIIVMEDGKILAQGNHNYLTQHNTRYQMLCKTQLLSSTP